MTIVMGTIDNRAGLTTYSHPLCFAEKRGLPELHARIGDIREVEVKHLPSVYCRFCQQPLEGWPFGGRLVLLSYDVAVPGEVNTFGEKRVTAVDILKHFTCDWPGSQYWYVHIFSYEGDCLRCYVLLKELAQEQRVLPNIDLLINVRDNVPGIYKIAS